MSLNCPHISLIVITFLFAPNTRFWSLLSPNFDLKILKQGFSYLERERGEGGDRDRLGNDQEIKFQEIKLGVFQEIETLFRRSKVFLIRKSKVFLIRRSKLLSNYQKVKIIVKLSGDQKSHFKFWSPEIQEIRSLKTPLKAFFRLLISWKIW
jgi:hypothetical protein